MEIISNDYAIALRNQIRDADTDSNTLKHLLVTLGNGIGQKIIEKYFLEERIIVTPMGEKHSGYHISNKKIVVVSTKDDYKYFGNGVASVFQNVSRGFMDFAGVRGKDAFTCPLREINLPDKNDVDAVVIAKSVLATGCTAITLAKRSVEKYNPEYLFIASVFYSEEGVQDIEKKCRCSKVFVIGEPDQLRYDGMLVPGFGDLDKRLST